LSGASTKAQRARSGLRHCDLASKLRPSGYPRASVSLFVSTRQPSRLPGRRVVSRRSQSHLNVAFGRRIFHTHLDVLPPPGVYAVTLCGTEEAHVVSRHLGFGSLGASRIVLALREI
jgi:hypothetical protein